MEIHNILKQHPGKTPVRLHFQNSAGKRATIEADESFHIRRSEELELALSRWIEDD